MRHRARRYAGLRGPAGGFSSTVTAVASSSQAQPSKSPAPSGVVAGTYALTAAPLLVLTQDERLIATLGKVSENSRVVKAVGSEIDLAAAQMSQQAGVAVLDTAAVATPIEQLSARLHAQFPELVLIVAGNTDEQGALAAQITDGSVHRFLHKPVSEQRVRLFVESAWKRHEELRAGAGAAGAGATPRRPLRVGLVLAALLAALTPLAWFVLRGTPAPEHRAQAAATKDAALEDLLTRADAALKSGALTAPPQENAAALYREALKRNARDPRAMSGLEQVISRLITDAETQLQEHHLDAAQQLVDAARAINPSHPRVAFLAAQLGAQRERAVLGKAQRAAAGGDVNAALAVLDDAARGGHRSSLVDEERAQLAQQQVDARVGDFLARGRDAQGRGALITPAEDNAHFYIESARALAPSDPGVLQARAELATRLEAESRQAAGAGKADQADAYASAAAESGATAAEVDTLHAAAQQLRGAAAADQLVRTEALFNQRLAQGKLIEPASDSAKYYLEQLAQAEPASAATLAARSTFATRLLAEAHSAVQAQDLGGARRLVSEARAAGAGAEDLSGAEAEIAAAAAPRSAPAAAAAPLPAAPPPAAAESATVNASTLNRTRYVAPQYPDSAQARSLEGWVDLQFLVNTDGTLSEVTIVGAQPVGVFEQAALDAVKRWRYQPVVRDGRPVTQRARLRVRFAVQP